MKCGYVVVPHCSTHVAYVEILEDMGFHHKGEIIDSENAQYVCNRFRIIELYNMRGIVDHASPYDINVVLPIHGYPYFKNMERAIFYCARDRMGDLSNFTGVYKEYNVNGFAYYVAEYEKGIRHGLCFKIYTDMRNRGAYAFSEYKNGIFIGSCKYIDNKLSQMNIGENITLDYDDDGNLSEKSIRYRYHNSRHLKTEKFNNCGNLTELNIFDIENNITILNMHLSIITGMGNDSIQNNDTNHM